MNPKTPSEQDVCDIRTCSGIWQAKPPAPPHLLSHEVRTRHTFSRQQCTNSSRRRNRCLVEADFYRSPKSRKRLAVLIRANIFSSRQTAPSDHKSLGLLLACPRTPFSFSPLFVQWVLTRVAQTLNNELSTLEFQSEQSLWIRRRFVFQNPRSRAAGVSLERTGYIMLVFPNSSREGRWPR